MKNNQINLAIKTIPTSLDPLQVKSGYHVLVTQALFQTLVRANTNGEITPSLVTRWDFKQEGKEVQFSLAEAFFHSGEKVSVDDVIFSLARHLWADSKSLDRDILRELVFGGKVKEKEIPSGLRKTSEKTFSIILNRPYPGLLALLSIANMSVISQKEFGKGKYIGSGPFVLVDKGSQLKLSRYDAFNVEKVPLKHLHIYPFVDTESAKKLLSGGLVDLVYWGVELDINDERVKRNFDTIVMDSPVFLHLFLNSRRGIFADKVSRSHFRDLLITFCRQSKHKGELRDPVSHLIPKGLLPLHYYKRAEVKMTPEKFKSLVSSNIQYKIIMTGNLFRPEFKDEFVEYLKKAGLNFEIEVLERSKYVDQLLTSKGGDLIFGVYGADFPDIDGIIPPILGTGGWSYGKFDNKDILKEIESVKYISSPVKRLDGYAKIIRQFEQDSLAFPMFRDRVKILARKDLSIPKPNYRYESELWRIFWQ